MPAVSPRKGRCKPTSASSAPGQPVSRWRAEFIGTRYRVAVLESGGLRYSGRVQRLYAGENAGLPSYALTYSRFRVFGGSTTRWPAQCRPLDPIDFQCRPGIADSGWPFDHRHLDAWYPRAQAVCMLGVDGKRAWAPDPAALPLGGELEPIFFVSLPARLRQAYDTELEQADNVEVLLNANAVPDPTCP